MFPNDTKVLILDDMPAIRQMLKGVMREMGFTDVTAVENGQIGYDLLIKAEEDGKPFQLILSDWNMPVLSGIELLKKVRAHPTLTTTPFLLVTAEGEFSNVKEAVAYRVSSYILKPFNRTAIDSKLRAVWKQILVNQKKAA